MVLWEKKSVRDGISPRHVIGRVTSFFAMAYGGRYSDLRNMRTLVHTFWRVKCSRVRRHQFVLAKAGCHVKMEKSLSGQLSPDFLCSSQSRNLLLDGDQTLGEWEKGME